MTTATDCRNDATAFELVAAILGSLLLGAVPVSCAGPGGGNARDGSVSAPSVDAVAVRDLPVPSDLLLDYIVVSRDESGFIGTTSRRHKSLGVPVVLRYSKDGRLESKRAFSAEMASSSRRPGELLLVRQFGIHRVDESTLLDSEPSIASGAAVVDAWRVQGVDVGESEWVTMQNLGTSRCELVEIASRPIRILRTVVVDLEEPELWCVIPRTRTVLAVARESVDWISMDDGTVRRRIPWALGDPGNHAAATGEWAWFSSNGEEGVFTQVPVNGSARPTQLRTGVRGRTALALSAYGRYLGVVVSRLNEVSRATDCVAVLYSVLGDGVHEVHRADFSVTGGVVSDVGVIESSHSIVVSLGGGGGRIVEFGATLSAGDADKAPGADERR